MNKTRNVRLVKQQKWLNGVADRMGAEWLWRNSKWSYCDGQTGKKKTTGRTVERRPPVKTPLVFFFPYTDEWSSNVLFFFLLGGSSHEAAEFETVKACPFPFTLRFGAILHRFLFSYGSSLRFLFFCFVHSSYKISTLVKRQICLYGISNYAASLVVRLSWRVWSQAE